MATDDMIDVWTPIEYAPKGTYREYITDEGYVEPPKILMYFPEDKKILICRYSFYYSPCGAAYRNCEAWVEDETGELAIPKYGKPTHWMPLPEAPENKHRCQVNDAVCESFLGGLLVSGKNINGEFSFPVTFCPYCGERANE